MGSFYAHYPDTNITLLLDPFFSMARLFGHASSCGSCSNWEKVGVSQDQDGGGPDEKITSVFF